MTSVVITPLAMADLTVKLSLVVTDAADGETFDVTRQVGTSSPVAVMGATGIAAESTVIADPEAPLNKAASWTVTLADGSTVTSTQITLAAETAVLSDPTTGVATSVLVTKNDDAITVPMRAEALSIENSSEPVVVWDKPAARQSEVEVLTKTAAQSAAMNSLLATGNPLLLRCCCGWHDDVWIHAVESVVPSRLVVKPSAVARLWAFGKCVRYGVNPVLDTLARANTLGDVYDAVTVKTLGAIADTWSTLGAIAEADFGSLA